MKKKIIDFIKFISFLGLGIFLIWWFLKDLSADQRKEIWHSFLSANYWIVAASMVIGILSFILRSVRWHMLLESMNYKPKQTNTLMSVMIGYLANLAFPRLGEVLRCGILDRYEKIPFTKSVGTVITERVLDMLVFVLLIVLTLLVEFDHLKVYFMDYFSRFADKFNPAFFIKAGIVLIIFLVLVIFFLVYFRKKVAHTKIYQKLAGWIKNMWEGLISLKNLRRPWLFICYTIALWACYFFMSYLMFFALAETSSLGLSAGLACVTFGTVGMIVTPGGIGLFPVIIAQTLLLYGISEITGYALGWLMWTPQNILILLGGLVSLVVLPMANKKTGK